MGGSFVDACDIVVRMLPRTVQCKHLEESTLLRRSEAYRERGTAV